MSYLYVSDQSAVISYSANRFQVKYKDGMLKSIPAEMLEVIEVFGNVQITTQCLRECLQRGINIIYYSTKGAYFGRVISPGHVNVFRQRRQAELGKDEKFCLEFSKKIIDAKIHNQIVVLRRYARNSRENIDRPVAEMKYMQQKVVEMAKSVDQLMGYEGNAARIYFRTLGKLIDPEFAFTGRNRRPPLDPFNSMLSLGYSIILNEIYGKLEGKGLNPYFGMLHQDREKHPTLASDMMEEWRAVLIDTTVMGILNGHELSVDDFYSEENKLGVFLSDRAFKIYLKKLEEKFRSDEEAKMYLQSELEKDSFLPKQVNKDNGVIPYQVHKYELKKILDNLGDKIPFLKENAEKIEKLFSFRIPYYVGPLRTGNGENSKFAWAERKSTEKIYPWNFENVIDVEQSAENFIRRMTNKCTYLIGEDVLPKDSLLYSKFMVLNELNNLRLDGQKISVELKQKIYRDVFCRSRKVTQKKLKSYLIREGIAGKNVELTGIDGDFKGSLTAYHDFKEKLIDVELTQKEKEEIILNIVLFGDDKKLLKQRLKKKFPQLTEKQINTVTALSYKGWGRLSKKLLEEVTVPAPETGEVWNIITALWETNDNFMQLLSKEYQFSDRIEEFNEEKADPEVSYQTIEDLYVSPAVKRQIWQTLQIIQEIEKVMGEKPKRVFVEMAREKQENKRTESRKKTLSDLYTKCKKEEPEWIEALCTSLEKHEEHQLRSDKLYLYYTQKGRCMYSGEPIDLEDLWDNTKYDIDHIYPQSKTMDDSLKNRVLVKKEYNAKKSDTYPIAADIQKKMMPFWKSLLTGGFIPKEKYDRLVRNNPLDANELAGFIERQIVETRQSTKAVAEILKKILPDTEIVYVKAKTVSKFRQDFDFIKVRDMNDLHHAKDAYLNIVVGNVYFVKFTKNAAWFVKENPGRTYNLEKMFIWDVARDGEIAWKAGKSGSIVQVRAMMEKNHILVTRRSYEVKGGLFDQQILKKGKGQVPVKESDERLRDIGKYGGYNKAAGAYFMLVSSKDKKGKEQRTIEFVPIYLKDRVEKDMGSKNKIIQENTNK